MLFALSARFRSPQAPVPSPPPPCQLGEWFLYVKNELYAPLFPAHKGLRGGSGGAKPAAARKTNGKITAASGGAISKANGANGAKAA